MYTLVSLVLAIAVLGYPAVALAAEPSHVIVDPSDQHTTTFLGVPKALPESEFAALKQSLTQRSGAVLIAWHEFKGEPEKYIRPHIRRNDYANEDVVGGLVQLLERYDGNPFGLTWNGGLAVTQNDYAHSARTFLIYTEPSRDPVHPKNHLAPLLRR